VHALGAALFGPSEEIFYSDGAQSAALEDVVTLWSAARSDSVYAEPDKVKRALANSFTVRYAFAVGRDETPKLVGFARTVSDGLFAAQVLDVIVAPAYQQRGIGRRLLRDLCAETRHLGPTSIASFVAPGNRLFFFRCGFR